LEVRLEVNMNNMKPKFLDHVVLIVADIPRTINFYNSFFGRPVSADENSVCYEIGYTKLFFGLPFKEYKILDKDSGGINHFAFGVRTVDELKKFEEKLDTAGIVHSGIQIDTYGKKEFIWFDDPDGYRLEFYLRPNEASKDFLGWFQIKERLQLSDHKPPLFKEGEVWWCYIGENMGIEINGKGDIFTRPIFILKKYDKYSFLGLPLSTKIEKGTWYVQVEFSSKQQTVSLNQGRIFDYRRFKEKMGQMEEFEIEKVRKGYIALHTFSKP